MKVRFQDVTLRAVKSVKCAGRCGRNVRRTKTFWQTLNPFNKNQSGVVKTRDEIQAELREERDAWMAVSETCSHCG